LGKKQPKRGIPKLEWKMLSDAMNHVTLSGDSGTCVLTKHTNPKSWGKMVVAAKLMNNATNTQSTAEETNIFNKAKNKFPVKGIYRFNHVYRSFGYFIGFESSIVTDIFSVDAKWLSIFKKRLSPLVATIAACQCQNVLQNEYTYNLLLTVSNNLPKILRSLADLNLDEEKELEGCFHFGPNRFVKDADVKEILRLEYGYYKV
jgi:hypothetical protein